MKTNEIYKAVTDKIIKLLESHQENWQRPWIMFGQDNDFGRNPKTGKYYRGINQFLLSLSMQERQYLRNEWMTFKQIKDKGGHVLKGEKSIPIIFYKSSYLDDNKKYVSASAYENMTPDQQSAINKIPILKLYRVLKLLRSSRARAVTRL